MQIITNGLNASADEIAANVIGTREIVYDSLNLIGNGNLLLLAASIAGIALAAKVGHLFPKSISIIVTLQILTIGILYAALPDIIGTYSGYRFLLPAFLMSALLMGAGIYYLYRYRRLFGILALCWLFAGVSFLQSTTDWRQFIPGLDKAFHLPPWQVIARIAPTSPPPLILGTFDASVNAFSYNRRIPYSQRLHFFAPKGMPFLTFADLSELHSVASQRAAIQPRIWLLYDQRGSRAADVDAMMSTMHSLDYGLCEMIPVGASWRILAFSWNALDCGDILLTAESQNDLVIHKFYDVSLGADAGSLTLMDSWQAVADFAHQDFSLSYQLVSTDWANIAQVDLPMVHPGEFRRFAIDTSDVPPGNYRLMLILYNRHTGQRVNWAGNPGYLLDMMELKEVEVR